MHAGLLASKKGFSWGTNVNFKSAGDYQNKYDGYVFNSGFNSS
jgi:iron complex outermembrane receptor protein